MMMKNKIMHPTISRHNSDEGKRYTPKVRTGFYEKSACKDIHYIYLFFIHLEMIVYR